MQIRTTKTHDTSIAYFVVAILGVSQRIMPTAGEGQEREMLLTRKSYVGRVKTQENPTAFIEVVKLGVNSSYTSLRENNSMCHHTAAAHTPEGACAKHRAYRWGTQPE